MPCHSSENIRIILRRRPRKVWWPACITLIRPKGSWKSLLSSGRAITESSLGICHYSLDAIISRNERQWHGTAGIVQPSLASFGDVAVGACYCSLGFWKGDSVSMENSSIDCRLLTNSYPNPCSQTFPGKPKMGVVFVPTASTSLGPWVSISSEGLMPEEVTVGPGCVAWMRAWPGSSRSTEGVQSQEWALLWLMFPGARGN